VPTLLLGQVNHPVDDSFMAYDVFIILDALEVAWTSHGNHSRRRGLSVARCRQHSSLYVLLFAMRIINPCLSIPQATVHVWDTPHPPEDAVEVGGLASGPPGGACLYFHVGLDGAVDGRCHYRPKSDGTRSQHMAEDIDDGKEREGVIFSSRRRPDLS
jgi:hypothetical protein